MRAMIRVQKRIFVFLGLTLLLASLVTISHYNETIEQGDHPPQSHYSQRFAFSDANKRYLIKLLSPLPLRGKNPSGQPIRNVDKNDSHMNVNSILANRSSNFSSKLLISEKQQLVPNYSNLPSSLSPPPNPSSSSPLSPLSFGSTSSNPNSSPPRPSKSQALISSSSSSAKLAPRKSSSSLSPFSSSSSTPSSSSLPSSSTNGGEHQSKESPLPLSRMSSPPSSSSSLVNLGGLNSSGFTTINSSKNSLAISQIAARPTTVKPTFEADQIATINHFKIDKPNYCDTDHGASLDLLVLVTSSISNFEARQAIRETWGKFAVERGALLLFVIGNTHDQTLLDKVSQEDHKYSDLLQASFIDNYYNLTLKTMSMLKWISDNCDKVKFVLKVDDDMFMNMQILVDFCETRTFSKSIIGHIAKRWRPHRDPKSKWFVPESAFNRSVYPNFATGPCYLISGDAATPLLQTALKLKAIYLEDVFITGIVAEAANIRRLNYSLMKNVRVKVTPCNFKRFMTSHKHSPKEISTLWNLVYDNIDKPCDNKPPSKPNIQSIKNKALIKGAKN